MSVCLFVFGYNSLASAQDTIKIQLNATGDAFISFWQVNEAVHSYRLWQSIPKCHRIPLFEPFFF